MPELTNDFSATGLDGLKTLLPDGEAPETRMGDAFGVQFIINQRIQSDQTRARKRSLVKGLVDGNPPYRAADLRDAGRSDACNVNWRVAESYLNSALGAFYDIFSEAPTLATVTADLPDPNKSADASLVITKNFHWLLKQEDSFDYSMQISQEEMVLYGVGPMTFEDEFDWRNKPVKCMNCLVPENTKSDVNEWEEATVVTTYYPHELWEFIKDEKAASDRGWNVEATKRAIMSAHPKYLEGGNYLTWEWHQQQLKNGSLYYSAQSKVIVVGNFYCKEFGGKISHAIVLVNQNNQLSGQTEFLFQKLNRYDNWRQAIHPMYYDHGGGGEHHSVTGMGVKMYAAMEYQNRLLCNLADKTFAPKILFRPLSANDEQKMSLTVMGDYGVTPANIEIQNVGVSGYLNDGLAFNREVSGTIASNLSQYRQNLQKEDGNPITATETQFRASEQSRLGKTQLNRYYQQLDALYAEKFRRATNTSLTKSNPGGELALEFQKRCKDEGVDVSAFEKCTVTATRIIGQGSSYQRQQSLEFLLGMVGMLPEDGRDNLIRDVIAARAGQAFVNRYYAKQTAMENSGQQVEAMLQVASMKIGVPPVVEPHQNPVIFAEAFLNAGAQAAGSLEKGANPTEVASFLEMVGPAVGAHLQRMAQDKSRTQVLKALTEQWKKLAQVHDSLLGQLQQQQDKHNQAQAAAAKESISIPYDKCPPDIQRQIEAAAGFVPSTQASQPTPEMIIKAEKAKQDLAIKSAKAQQHIQIKTAQTQQDMALKDAETAHRLHLNAQAADGRENF